MVSNVNRLPDRVPGGFSATLVRPTAKGACAPDKVIISMPRRGARTHSGGKAAVGRVRVCESKPPLPSPFPAAFHAALPHFYALFPPPCISYHTKMQIYDDILCPASFFCGGAADRRPPTTDRRLPTANRRTPTADRRPPTADRKKALPFREAPFGTIQLHQPGGQVMSRPAST